MKNLLLSLSVLALVGCVTERTSSTSSGYSRTATTGVVVEGGPDFVWQAALTSMQRLSGGNVDFNTADYRMDGTVDGADVWVQVSPQLPGHSILRVHAKRDGRFDPDVADRVVAAITSRL